MQNKPRLTYANIVSTLALFLVLGGSAAYAADKIRSGDIAPGAVRTSDVFKRAIVSGKIAVDAVRSNQIADGAVGSKQIGAGAVAPSNLQFPVSFVASPTGGSAPVAGGPTPYPLADSTWVQKPGEIDVIFGAAVATLAYDESGPGSCRVYFEINLNGQQVGGGEVSTGSTTLQQVEQDVGAQPQMDPVAPTTNQLSVQTASNGACTPDSTIDSTRFRVLDFG
ncbi:MAG TPA: hypothetical protein VID51_08370 [Solirubrobacterales bacterium]|jgi:hypothetical protein